VQLFELVRVHFRRGVHHQVGGAGVLGEGNHLANAVNAAMMATIRSNRAQHRRGGRAVLEGIQQEAEAAVRFLGADAQNAETSSCMSER